MLDIEQLCTDLKAGADNASESPEACDAQLSEDVNAQAASNESDATLPINAGLAALAGWAALKGKRQSTEQRLDRSEYALVAAKAQSKRFVSWARFRD